MPLMAQTWTPVHHTARLPGGPGALDDARPDRWGEKVIRYLYKPGASVFDSLYFAGDERFGAMGVSTSTSREPNLSEAMTVVDDFDLFPLEAANTVLKIIAVVNEWQSHFRSVGVTEPDITEMAALIDAPELLAQRQSFSPGWQTPAQAQSWGQSVSLRGFP